MSHDFPFMDEALIVPDVWMPGLPGRSPVVRVSPVDYEDAVKAAEDDTTNPYGFRLTEKRYCAHCLREVPGHQFEGDRSLLAGRTYSYQSGCVIIEHPAGALHYCCPCAAMMNICRGCGCTDECACEGGCFWVAPDLCSTCSSGGTSRNTETPARRAA